MAVLREQEAVDYLERTKSVIHPKTHPFSQLPLLYKMLDVEAAYLQKVSTEEAIRNLAEISIEPSGFPELVPWLVDLNQAFLNIDQVRAFRAQAMIPLIQQFANASPEGITQASGYIASAFDQDRALAKALEGFTPEQRALLTIENTRKFKLNRDFPFMNRENIPGMLIVYDSKVEKELEKDKEGKITRDPSRLTAGAFYNIPLYAGLKFIDADPPKGEMTGEKSNPARTPILIYAALADLPDEPLHPSSLQILTPHTTLMPPSNRNPEFNWAITRNNGSYIDIQQTSRQENRSNANNESWPSADYETLKTFTNITNGSRPSTIGALLSIDISGLTYTQADVLLGTLPEFNSLIADIVHFSESIINGYDISTERFIEKNTGFANRLSVIFNAIDDEAVKRTLQLALASETKPIQDKAHATAGTANIVVYQEDDVEEHVQPRKWYKFWANR